RGAARRVFAVRGFRGTTIADIAEEARIALGTIYLYFPSKEAVFAALNETLNDLISGAIADVAPEGSLRETVRRRVDNVFAVCARNRDLLRLVVLNTDPGSDVTLRLRRAADERLRPLVAEFERGVLAGALRPGDAAIMARLASGLVSIAVYQAFVLSDGEAADQYAAECAEMITAYVSPPPSPPVP
ncbi:MAG TPA: TetR/AcrR family transcriptional regulator, partial [Dehalococcoidia bacterium]|nr:TetR/AcrR family transcriptional regulator [Dehalococcoidia bacterium]